MRLITPSTIRLALLLAVALNLAMMGLRVLFYRPFLEMPGNLRFIAEPALLLVVYGLLVLGITLRPNPVRQMVVELATPFGLAAGGMQAIHILLEDAVDFGAANGTLSLLPMAGMFALWGVAGYRAGRMTNAIGAGALAGSWSAMVTMVVTVTVGFALLYTSIPRLEYVATWPEFQRSGWKDVHAFSIANTLESGFSHLLFGPVIGVIVGGIAGVVADLRRKPKPRPV